MIVPRALQGLCLGVLAAALAPAAGAVDPAPSLACDAPVHDFGRRPNVEHVKHVFTLTNRGTATLHIERLRVCCGATADVSSMEIAPGATADVHVDLSLLGRKGKQRKSIYVVCDDPERPYYRLQLVGTVTTEIDITPDRVEFGAVDAAAALTRSVRLSAQAAGVAFQVTNVTATVPHFRASFEPEEKGRSYLLTVRTVAPLPSGLARGKIVVLTDYASQPIIELLVTARVDSEVVVVPQELVLRAATASAESPVTRYLAIRRRDGADFTVLDVEAPDGVETTTSTLGKHGHRFTVRVTRAPVELDGLFLTVRTDAEGMEEIDIPIRYGGE